MSVLVDEDIQAKIKESVLNNVPSSASSVHTVNASAPEDVFATMFHLYVPIMKNILPRLSKKQLKRLLSALVEVPLNDKPYKILDSEERKLYNMLDALFVAKYAMVLQVLTQQEAEKQAIKDTIQNESKLDKSDDANSDTISTG